jgi:hypothetical protein
MKKDYRREKTRMSGFQMKFLFSFKFQFITSFLALLILMDGKQLLEKQVV